MWKKLEELSENQNKSVGELVRNAVSERYFGNSTNSDSIKAYRVLMNIRKKIGKKNIDYKELINAGRKF